MIRCDLVDITDIVTTYTWSGSASQAARGFEFTVINPIYDASIKLPNIKLGSAIKFYDESKKILFYGTISSRERDSTSDSVSYHAYDLLNHLLRSNKSYTFRVTTPEKVARMVCGDLGIKTGTIVETKVDIPRMFVDGESYYNVIMMAYTKARKVNKKKYMIAMDVNKLCVIEKGKLIENYVLREGESVQSSYYSEDLESMVNRVKIYDDKGHQIGEVKNDGWMSKYGIYQDVYTKEKGINSTKAAQSMLTGISKSANLEAIGNVACISGYAIKIRDAITGLSGKFWIESDSHTWENGIHTMHLELAFENIMELVNEQEQKEEKKTLLDNDMVWTRLTASKYHATKTCSNMQSAKSMTVAAAKKLSKTACKKCIG